MKTWHYMLYLELPVMDENPEEEKNNWCTVYCKSPLVISNPHAK